MTERSGRAFDYLIVGAGFAGSVLAERLATYRYYNMDQVVAQALMTFKKLHPDGK